MSLKTLNGQEIELYPAGGSAQVERREHGRTYRLCQILPAAPQRFEWIRLDHIAELPRDELERRRRTPRPRAEMSAGTGESMRWKDGATDRQAA